MIKSLKFYDSEESQLFVTGCLHIGHVREFVWQKRGFSSPEEHSRAIISIINNICKFNDNLLVLGDFCLNTSREKFLSIVSQINCQLLFIRGNHNNPWEKMYLEECDKEFGYEVVGYKWLNKITYLGDYLTFNWNKQFCVANHYPYYVFDGMAKGYWSLCSHSHGTCELTLPQNTKMKQLDCGWDIHKKPLSFNEIKKIMENKNIPNNDHHNKI